MNRHSLVEKTAALLKELDDALLTETSELVRSKKQVMRLAEILGRFCHSRHEGLSDLHFVRKVYSLFEKHVGEHVSDPNE